MFTRFSDLDRTFTVFDELRRRMDRVWDAYEPEVAPAAYDNAFYASTSWPRVDVTDAGQSLVFRAEVPGVAEKDFNLTLTADTLTLAGERKAAAPEGYTIQRQERPAARFSRSWTLPYKVDAEKTTATLKDGVLTIALAKAAESQPRQIAVRVQS